MEITDPLFILCTQYIIAMDFTVGALNFVFIGLARAIKNYNTDLYLDLGVDYNWNCVTPINILIAVAFQLFVFFGCDSIESQCYENSKTTVLMTILFIAFLLHFIVWFHLSVRYCKGQTVVVSFLESSNDLINFSMGSYTLLILALVCIICGISFQILNIPITSVTSSVVQLTNLTAVSIFWTYTNDKIRNKELRILRRFFYQDNSFTVHV